MLPKSLHFQSTLSCYYENSAASDQCCCGQYGITHRVIQIKESWLVLAMWAWHHACTTKLYW